MMIAATMETALRRLVDKDEIKDVLFTYCRGIDRCDEALLRSVYHPGATDDHGLFAGTAEAFVDWLLPVLQGFAATQHTLGNILIALDGDRAHVESYYNAFHRVPEPSGDRDVIVAGRYVDDFERRAGVWKIRARQVLCDWTRNEAAAASKEWQEQFKRGERSRADFVYKGST